MTYQRDSHCSYCGQAFPPEQPWPRTCVNCGNMTFRNPAPVTSVLIPVDEGVLVVRRTIEPRKGTYSLPGGFVDLDESWQESCAREAYEEAHVRIDPAQVKLVTVASAPDQTIVIVGQTAPLKAADLPPFHANGEVDDRRILTTPERLAWPIHTEMVEKFLKSRSAR